MIEPQEMHPIKYWGEDTPSEKWLKKRLAEIQRRYERAERRLAKLEAIIATVADEMSEAEEIDTEDWQRMLRTALNGEKADG